MKKSYWLLASFAIVILGASLLHEVSGSGRFFLDDSKEYLKYLPPATAPLDECNRLGSGGYQGTASCFTGGTTTCVYYDSNKNDSIPGGFYQCNCVGGKWSIKQCFSGATCGTCDGQLNCQCDGGGYPPVPIPKEIVERAKKTKRGIGGVWRVLPIRILD